jgi:hypothetical protein
MRNDYTVINERTIAGSGLGASPELIAGLLDQQRATYVDGPADTSQAQATAEQGVASAAMAQSSADGAQASADQAGTRADAAQIRADAAYALANAKVAKDAGPTWQAPTATSSRAAFADYTATATATYTQADVQALMDRVSLLTKLVAALVTDGRNNHSLTN